MMVKRMNDCDRDERNNGDPRSRYVKMLRCLIERVDNVFLFQANNQIIANGSNFSHFLGQNEADLTDKDMPREPFDFTKKINRGQYLFHRAGDTTDSFRLCQCITDANSQGRVVLVLKSYTKGTLDINNTNSLIVEDNKSDLDATDLDSIVVEKEWSSDKLKKNGFIITIERRIIPPGDAAAGIAYRKKDLIKINGVIRGESTSIQSSIPSLNIIEVTLNSTNTQVFKSGASDLNIPNAIHFETPLETEPEITPEQQYQSPCTFIALFQSEILGGNTKTSVKRYFGNYFDVRRTSIKWHIYCKRWFQFQEEELKTQLKDTSNNDAQEQEEAPELPWGASAPAQIDNMIDRNGPAWSRPDSEDFNFSIGLNSIDSVNSTDHRKDGEGFTSTRLLRFEGKHIRIYINIFLIFHHWARHDYGKTGADEALYDPLMEIDGFDTTHPQKTTDTNLKPWMFTVTQAFRDWVCTMISFAQPERQDYDGVALGKSITSQLQIVQDLFDPEKPNITDQLSGKPTHLDPIIAALDWKKPQYDRMIHQARDILCKASITAFHHSYTALYPKYTPNRTLDINGPSGIAQYITETIEFLRSSRTKDRRRIDSQTLAKRIHTDLGIPTEGDDYPYIPREKFDAFDELMGKTQVLYINLLKEGDMLGVYDKNGCRIVRFIRWEEKVDVTSHEKAFLRAPGQGEEASRQEEWNNFKICQRHLILCRSSVNTAEPDIYENYTNVYLLTPRVQP